MPERIGLMQHDNWIPTKGKEPRFKEQPYYVRFRCGHESNQPYVAKQLRWNDTGCEWDIIAVRRA